MFSTKIKSLMKEKHITATQLSEYLGIAEQSLSRKFLADRFTVNELIRILDYLDCELLVVAKTDIKFHLNMDDI